MSFVAESSVPTMKKREPSETVRNAVGTVTVAELHARCSVVEPGVVLLREVPNNTVDTYEVLIDRAFEIGVEFDRWTMVVDLSEVTERPKGKYLALIRERSINPLGSPGAPVHLATTQPGSIFLRAVLAYVLGRMSPRTSVHPTRDAALAACRTALARAE